MEAEKKENELQHLREQIRVCDQCHGARDFESGKQDDEKGTMEKQLEDTLRAIKDAQTCKKSIHSHAEQNNKGTEHTEREDAVHGRTFAKKGRRMPS
jgi:hypothetical protein